MTPEISFSIALTLLALFIWYFGTDSEKRQRLIGTILTLGLVGFCLVSLLPPDEKINKGMDLAGGVRFTLELQLPEDAKENDSERFISRSDQDEAKAVLERRLSASAVSDVSIVPVGKDRLAVIFHIEKVGTANKLSTKKLSTLSASSSKNQLFLIYT